MASLRNLLGQEFQSTLGGVEGQIPEPLHKGKVITITYDKECCCYACGWTGSRLHMWCVPRGVCKVTFEAWGGGGGSASSCCCTVSTPGTLGGYTRKTIYPTPGDCYCLCIGYVEGQPDGYTDKRGCRGRFVTICGPNVTLCAEGGYGGCAICNFILANGSYFGVNRPVFFPNEASNCVDCGAPAWGGDVNIRGLGGYMRVHCSDNRAVIQHVPYPPYRVNASGGWVTYHNCATQTCSYHRMHKSIGSFVGVSGSYDSNGDKADFTAGAGFPYPGSNTTDSCCVYGSSASAGMIRITYMGDECNTMASCCTALHMCN